jgi:hypothetical protein
LEYCIKLTIPIIVLETIDMINSINLKENCINRLAIFMIVGTIAVALIIASSITIVFAQPHTSGYKSSGDCKTKSTGGKTLQTCCWRTSTGTSLGDTYCQTCTLNSDAQPITCGQPELQFRSTIGNVPSDNNDGGVAKDPGISDKETINNIPIDGGVLSNQP